MTGCVLKQNGVIRSHNKHRLQREVSKLNLLQDNGIDIFIDNS